MGKEIIIETSKPMRKHREWYNIVMARWPRTQTKMGITKKEEDSTFKHLCPRPNHAITSDSGGKSWLNTQLWTSRTDSRGHEAWPHKGRRGRAESLLAATSYNTIHRLDPGKSTIKMSLLSVREFTLQTEVVIAHHHLGLKVGHHLFAPAV